MEDPFDFEHLVLKSNTTITSARSAKKVDDKGSQVIVGPSDNISQAPGEDVVAAASGESMASAAPVASSAQSAPVLDQPQSKYAYSSYASTSRTPRGKREERLVDCLSALSVAFCCPCLSVCKPFTVPMNYERVVIFRLGRLRGGPPRGPGVTFVNPFFDKYVTVDQRVKVVDLDQQEVLTEGGVMLIVDGVAIYRIKDVLASYCNVDDVRKAIINLCGGVLRSMLGSLSLSEILERKESTTKALLELVEEPTKRWGVEIISIEIKNIQLPTNFYIAMSKEAEKAKMALAQMKLSQGEVLTAPHLVKASNCFQTREAQSLRGLHTLASLANQSKKGVNIMPIYLPVEGWLVKKTN